MPGPVNFETLSAQESLEKKSRTLTQIEPSFFRYVSNYLEQLEEAYRKEQEKNSSSKKAAFLLDELRNASSKVEELWKAREKKIVAFAQVDARKDPAPGPPEHLTREEAQFYQALVKLFREQGQRMLPQRAAAGGGIQTPRPLSPSSPPIPPALPPSPSVEKTPAAAPSPTLPDEAQTVRALVDIPPFIGLDGKTYRIKKGEVLTLPKKFAALLKERNQATIVG